MVEGWFKVPGRTGERTLKEQLKGLSPALAEAQDKTVLDLGCAEGLIAMEFARSGAARVDGIDCNEDLVIVGLKLRSEGLTKEPRLSRVLLQCAPVQRLLPLELSYDVVLALAILHKMHDPLTALQWCAKTAQNLLVIRLAGGSRGSIKSKHYPHTRTDSRSVLANLGFALEREEQGPRDEMVHYWRRQC